MGQSNGWNRPSEGQKVESAKAGGVAWKRGLVCGIVIVIGAVAAWLILSPSSDGKKQSRDGKKALIKEVTPAKVKTPVVEKEAPKPIDPNARPTKVGEIVNGYVMLPSKRLHKINGAITNNASAVKASYEIFDHHCDNDIACLLTMSPGQTLVGTPRYNGRFKADFIESLKHPIIVSHDDTPEHAQLKRDVNAAKIELKAAMDRGEDIEQIMLDTRKEFQNLAIYKLDMKQQLNEFKKKEGVTHEDVEDFVKACNILLEKKGIAPLKLGPISRQKLIMMNQEKDMEK